ncbi:hypothetical protein BS47DRAFT_1264297, partial [Hydnum rufescens UP504]
HTPQLTNLPYYLITNYVVGHCGSTPDSTVFADSSLTMKPEDWLDQNEFIWDSAYALRNWCIVPYCKPNHLIPSNKTSNYYLSTIHIKSEHTMGYFKGHWGSLPGLRHQIKDEHDHHLAVNWSIACLILHNLILQIE